MDTLYDGTDRMNFFNKIISFLQPGRTCEYKNKRGYRSSIETDPRPLHRIQTGNEVIYRDYYGTIHNPHRPAIICPEFVEYCQNSNEHNIVGPSTIYEDGDMEYYINDVDIVE